MSTHTPGPWEVDPIRGFMVRTVKGQDHIYIGASDAPCRAKYREGEEEANARLIAAAPDLLAACKRAHLVLHSISGEADVSEQVRQAIAKAEGDAQNGGGAKPC